MAGVTRNMHGDEIVEHGSIDDIPTPDEIAKEKDPSPSPKLASLPKGFIVSPMDGVTVVGDTG